MSDGASKEIPVYETTRKQRTDINELKLSSEGRSFIKAWEVFSLHAYNDAKGYCTIGYGELIAKDRCERITLPPAYRNGITPQQADQLFEKRIPEFEKGLRDAITAKLFQHEYDALISLLFNCGARYLPRESAPQLKKKLNSGAYSEAAFELLDITSGGIKGLVKRRHSEVNLFLEGIYDATH